MLLIFLTLIFTNILSAQDTKVSGMIFSNFNMYISESRNDGTPSKDFNTFDIGRVYLTVSNKHWSSFYSKITFEANTLSNGNNVFLKLAYFSYTSENNKLYLDFGLIPSIWVGWEEGIWGNAFVEFTQMHYLKILNPSDKGFRVGYDLTRNLKIEAMVSNGEGFRVIENSKNKNLDAKITYSLNNFGVSGYYSTQLGNNEKETICGGIYYKIGRFIVGGSSFKTVEYSSMTSNTHKNGFALYSNYLINEKNSVFLRYDNYDKNISKTDDISGYWIAGFKNKPLNDLEWAVSYKFLNPQREKINFRKESYISSNFYVKF